MIKGLRYLAVTVLVTFFSAISIATDHDIDWDAVVVIDVRSLGEWNQGHLTDALWIPWAQIEQGIDRHGLTTEQPLAFYCARGVRADRAIRRLERLGYTKTYNLISLTEASRITGRDIIR